MGHSTVLIGLSLVTLLCGLSIAIYQLWSAQHAQQTGQRSALAARYGGKARSTPRLPEPIPPPVREETRIGPTTQHAEAEVITVPPPQAEEPEAESRKRSPRAPRRKPKPDLTPTA